MIQLLAALKFEGIAACPNAIMQFQALQGHVPCLVVARRAASLLRAGV